MAYVNIVDVKVLDNPTAFMNPFQFEITFECLQQLSEDIEWKVIYVGSAEDSQYDQVLEELMVGPIEVGISSFVLQVPGPDPRRIKNEDLLGVTVILITCSYFEQEFIRIGYFVSNEYTEPYDPESPPNPVIIGKLFRNVLSNEPRVTRFAIDWSGQNQLPAIDVAEAEAEAEVEEVEEDGNDEVVDMEVGETAADGSEEDEEEDEENAEDDEEDEENAEDDVDLDDYAEEDEAEIEVEEAEAEVKINVEAGTSSEMQPATVVMLNEDSMDVAMMQHNFDNSNHSNHGIF